MLRGGASFREGLLCSERQGNMDGPMPQHQCFREMTGMTKVFFFFFFFYFPSLHLWIFWITRALLGRRSRRSKESRSSMARPGFSLLLGIRPQAKRKVQEKSCSTSQSPNITTVFPTAVFTSSQTCLCRTSVNSHLMSDSNNDCETLEHL